MIQVLPGEMDVMVPPSSDAVDWSPPPNGAGGGCDSEEDLADTSTPLQDRMQNLTLRKKSSYRYKYNCTHTCSFTCIESRARILARFK